ncbi:MAG: branched-chain amino acid ABC transporter permease, partial [Actinobacteria bacterium]|nr:branched-chain amino acid ABC transporter permease [Actinomycetota bacterium]
MILLGQALIAGLGTGAVYALIAYGISLVLSVSKTLNFAHGEIIMTSLFATFVASYLGVNLPTAFLIGVAVAILLGIALQRFVFKPLAGRKG